MENHILSLLGSADYSPLNVPELLKALHLNSGQQQELQRHLKEMAKRGVILRTKGNRYIVASEADLVPGVISINRSGKGFVQPDEPGLGEIVIAERNTSNAMHGDRVLVRREVRPQGLNKPLSRAKPIQAALPRRLGQGALARLSAARHRAWRVTGWRSFGFEAFRGEPAIPDKPQTQLFAKLAVVCVPANDTQVSDPGHGYGPPP